MYCVRCGVKLADSEQVCPLCGTVPYHPDIDRVEAEPLYPPNRQPPAKVSPWAALIVTTVLVLAPILITLLCDLQINGAVTWSGYVMGALALGYVVCVLPLWFRRPEPVVFVACDAVAAILYLLYIDLAVQGGWFLGFAFPVAGFFGLLVTTVVALVRFVRRGRLYIFGGASLAAGVFMPVMELLILLTFHRPRFVGWSFYPMTALVLLGATLIFLAVCKPARDTMERKFFL